MIDDQWEIKGTGGIPPPPPLSERVTAPGYGLLSSDSMSSPTTTQSKKKGYCNREQQASLASLLFN
jgi:hypothetical protein